MRILTILLILGAVNSGVYRLACAQDVRNKVTVNPYENASVGDWVRRKWTSKPSMSFIEESTMDETETVTQKDDDRVVIVNKLTLSGGDIVESEKTISLRAPYTILKSLGFDPPGFPITASGAGEETITMAGREFDAKWETFSLKADRGGPESKSKIWRSQDVPLDGLVKRIHTTSTGTSIVELVEFGFANEKREHAKASTPKEEGQPIVRSKWTNSIGISLLPITSGSFTMGQMDRPEFILKSMDLPVDQRLEFLLQSPPKRSVLIERDFYAAANEVTIGQYKAFVVASGYKTDAEIDGNGGTGLTRDGRWGQSPEFTWQNYGFQVTDDYPVGNVSWNDANAFCKWLSRSEELDYRLLTEPEWEYCCRAGTETSFFTGDDEKSLEGFANVADVSLLKVTPSLPWSLAYDDGYPYFAPVGKFRANGFGLHDIHGNMLEWCSSEFDAFEPIPEAEAPEAPIKQYVVRGGHWFGEPSRAGSACRSGADPHHRMSLIGFRIATEGQPDTVHISDKKQQTEIVLPKSVNEDASQASKKPVVPRYRLTLLNDVQGRPTVAKRLSNTGIVLGFINQKGKHPIHCIWKSGTQTVVDLPGDSLVNDINDAGEWVATGVTKDRDVTRNYVWKIKGLTELSPKPANVLHMLAAINSKGQIAGTTFENSGVRSWVYENGGFTALADLGGKDARAFAINESGVVSGTAKTANGERHAFIGRGEKIRDLGTLGGPESEALDINDAGIVVGNAQTASGEHRAFVWKDKVMSELQTTSVVRMQGTASDAMSVNKLGWIVGGKETSNSPRQAVIWIDSVEYPLNELIDQADGWNLDLGASINDQGQIAATASKNGETSAVLLTPVPSGR